MTWTSHGHHIDGTAMDSSNRPVRVTRCGGSGLCGKCSAESARVLQKVRELESRTVEERWRHKPTRVAAVFWDGKPINAGPILNWLCAGLAYDAVLEGARIRFSVQLRAYSLGANEWIVMQDDKIDILKEKDFHHIFELDT